MFPQKNSSLLSLNISWNGFGFEGSVAMAHALRNNTTLTELDISSNRIHPPALYEFLKGFMHNRALQKLKVKHIYVCYKITFCIRNR